MRAQKIASITISLSWIFMIVVGSFFLLFAYNIISKYQDIEESKFELELKWGLREVFNSVGRTAGIEETKLNPLGGGFFEDREVFIECFDGTPLLSIDGRLDANNEFLQNFPVFMTRVEQDSVDRTFLGVESFRLPFKTTSVMTLVSTKNLIVFDENSEISEILLDKFRKSSYSELTYIVEDLSFEIFNQNTFMDSISDKNYNSVMFVTDSDTKFDFTFLDQIENSYYVKFNLTSSKYGSFTYVDSEGETNFFRYVDYDESQTMQTMAILSTPEVYDCSNELLLQNTIDSYNFYLIKTQRLLNLSKEERVCSSSVSLISQQQIHYDLLKESIENLKEEIVNDKFNKPGDIISLVDEVELAQDQLESLSCAYVY